MNISAPTSARDIPPARSEIPVAELIPVFARESELLEPELDPEPEPELPPELFAVHFAYKVELFARV